MEKNKNATKKAHTKKIQKPETKIDKQKNTKNTRKQIKNKEKSPHK